MRREWRRTENTCTLFHFTFYLTLSCIDRLRHLNDRKTGISLRRERERERRGREGVSIPQAAYTFIWESKRRRRESEKSCN